MKNYTPLRRFSTLKGVAQGQASFQRQLGTENRRRFPPSWSEQVKS